MFGPEFFINNRRKISTATSDDLIVLSANGLLQKSSDTTFAFRQDSNFWYLTGCEVPEAILVIDKLKATEYIILPVRLAHRDQWEGELDIKELSRISGIRAIYKQAEGWDYLKTALRTSKSIGTILPPSNYEPNYGMYINPAKLVFGKKVKHLAKDKLNDIRLDIARLRQVKSPEELTAIKNAVDITSSSLNELRQNIKGMSTENEVNIFLTHQFAKKGAHGHAYDPIIACGKNAATIHYEKNDALLTNGSLLLLDVGAQYHKYAADISRTWAIGKLTNRQQHVHDAVLRVHAFALSLLKPGVMLRDYEKTVRENMKKELLSLGLSATEDSKAHLKYYPHLTSHFLGIDVHDSGDYDAPLTANTVITVEPGIYIQEEGTGVRIEDDILITKDGYINLSAGVPTHLV